MLVVMKTFWVWLLVMMVNSSMAGSHDDTTSSSSSVLRSSDYSSKYSARQNRQNIPSLASLFNVVTYWDKNNSSSPCSHAGKKRDLECTKNVTFDRASYDKSIEDMKKLILSRLNLDHEPSIKVNQRTMRFIDQLENRVLAAENDDTDTDAMTSGGGGADRPKASIVKTKYDMKTPENRVFNVMHEAVHITSNCLGDNYPMPSLCINFEVFKLFHSFY